MKANSILKAVFMLALLSLMISCKEKQLFVSDKVDGVTMIPSAIFLTVGQEYQLTAYVTPSTAKDKSVGWSANLPAIATVKDGLVSAVGVGTTDIVVTTTDGAKTATCAVTVTQGTKEVVVEKPGTEPVAGLVFVPRILELVTVVNGGEAVKLTAKVMPENARDKTVLWSKGKDGSENNIISDDDGTTVVANYQIEPTGGTVTIHGVAVGIGTIFAIAKDDKTKAISMRVKVIASSPAESVVILPSVKPDLVVGGLFSATASVMPTNAANKKVKWSNSKNDNQLKIYGTGDVVIATYSIDPNDGNTVSITGVALGSGGITATSVEGSKVSTLQVTVSDAQPILVQDIQLSPSTTIIPVGDKATLTATITPSGVSNKNVSWSSSNPNVASVVNGEVTANKSGLATIIATSESDPSKFATCKVRVLKVFNLTIGEKGESIGSEVSGILSEGGKVEAEVFLLELKELANGDFQSIYVGSAHLKTIKKDVFDINYQAPDDYKIVKEGTETVYFQTQDNGGAYALFVIKVVDKTTLKINESNQTLNKDGEFTFTVDKTPDDVKVTWSSDKPEFVTVDGNGKVTAKAKGSAVITAKANTKTATVTVKVN